jgi:peptide/nickel transport system substrate-binding protein
MRPSGEEVDTTVETVDDLTIRFTFPEPNGLLPQWMAGNDGSDMVSFPAHHCGEFHEDFNDDIEALVADQGAEDWTELFIDSGCTGSGGDEFWQVTGVPTMHPWVLTTEYGSGSRVEAERNPYYWKVDTEGNQLPYLDRVVFSVVENEEVMLLNASNGEFDYHARTINRLRNRPVLVENSERGGYRLFDMVEAEMNTTTLHLNLTTQDPVLAETFRNRDVRVALSHAIDRQEIIDIVYQGQGEPWQAAPRPESGDLYDEELATQYTEFDLDLADRLLDEAGFAERNADGVRLLPDGRTFAFGMLVRSDQTEQVDTLNLVRRMWQAVGVDMRLDTVDRTLWEERRDANEYEAIASDGSGGLRDAFLENDNYQATGDGDSALWAPLWSSWWRSGGEEGQEPPEAVVRQGELYAELKASNDPEEQEDLMRQILDISREEFWTMGVSLPQAHYGIAGENFRNVPEGFADSSRFGTPGPVNPAQFFLVGGGS